MRYRPFRSYATPEQRDWRALDTLRVVLDCEAIERALAREKVSMP